VVQALLQNNSLHLKTLTVVLNEKKIKIQSSFTVCIVSDVTHPVRIYVNLVRVFGWKQIFIDDTLNLALRPPATRRLNIANLHVKVKCNQCWPADIPYIQDPATGPHVQEDHTYNRTTHTRGPHIQEDHTYKRTTKRTRGPHVQEDHTHKRTTRTTGPHVQQDHTYNRTKRTTLQKQD